MFRIKIVLLLLFVNVLASYAASIKGRMVLSDEWAPVIYISEISAFENLHTASYDFLRYQINLDSTGFFEIKDLEMPGGDRIYRLHVCKKGDPVSTILIGGQEENFLHFLMNETTDIVINQNTNLKGLQGCSISGHPAESELAEVFAWHKKLNTPLNLPSAQNRNLVKEQVYTAWRSMADTTSNNVVRLLAVYFINDSFSESDHLELMEEVQMDFADADSTSPYYDAFESELQFLQFQKGQAVDHNLSFSKWLWFLWLIPVGIIWYFLRLKINPGKQNATPDQKINTLSTQEKRVFSLLRKGKSNKEISSELHIEVSTVKSHLNKIYSRLGIKSRKEVIDKDL